MSVVLVGLSHRTAPVWIRERVAFASECGAARDAASGARLDEAVVLSTCNRVELYGYGSDEPSTVADRMVAYLAERAAMPVEVLHPYLFVHEGDEAVRHLCRVAAGIESMVLGETQIVAQIRRALAAARADGAAGRVLHRMTSTAFAAGKRARPLLPAAPGPTSVAGAAVRALGGVQALSGASVVVIGAGETAGDLLRALAGARPRRLVLVNRTLQRAIPLAARHGAALASWEALGVVASDADVVFACTAAAAPVLRAEHFAGAGSAPRTLVDLGVPRNVDAAVASLPGVTLLDVDAFGAGDASAVCPVDAAHAAAEAEVGRWAGRFGAWLRAQGAVPTIAALRADADRVRELELERALARLGALGPRERAVVRDLTARLVNKLLHRPVSALAGGDAEELAPTARRLFGLACEPAPVEPPRGAAPSSVAAPAAAPASR